MGPTGLPKPGVNIPVDLESVPSDFRIVGKWSAPLTQLDLTSAEKDESRKELLTGTHQAITVAIRTQTSCLTCLLARSLIRSVLTLRHMMSLSASYPGWRQISERIS